MESNLQTIILINDGIRLILTTEEPYKQNVLQELDGAVCRVIQHGKLDNSLELDWGLVIEKVPEDQGEPKEKKNYFETLLNAVLNKKK